MFQKFFTDTLMSKFIKGLLSNTNIPLLSFVKDGDFVLEGGIYIYRHSIIKCAKSGILFVDARTILYPSEELYPSQALYPGTGIQPAAFKVLAHYNNDDYSKYNYKYKSSVSYYDSETHRHLGNYLRYLRDKENINLLPYYNCYNYTSIPNMSLKRSGKEGYKSNIELVNNTLQGYKLAAVPIKFGRPYTIAIDCPTEVLMLPILYGPLGDIKISSNSEKTFSSEFLAPSGRIFASLKYNSPIIFNVVTEEIELIRREKYLYLLIQLPSDNTSSITVLEGDYRSTEYPLSLLMMNTQESYAFSDRLIEFLLQHTINNTESISNNIMKVQEILSKFDESYNYLLNSSQVTYGVWDVNISDAILRVVKNMEANIPQGFFLRDIDGNICKNIEELFNEQGVYIR